MRLDTDQFPFPTRGIDGPCFSRLGSFIGQSSSSHFPSFVRSSVQSALTALPFDLQHFLNFTEAFAISLLDMVLLKLSYDNCARLFSFRTPFISQQDRVLSFRLGSSYSKERFAPRIVSSASLLFLRRGSFILLFSQVALPSWETLFYGQILLWFRPFPKFFSFFLL